MRRIVSTVALALLMPVLAGAVSAPRDPRPHPGSLSARPSYVQRVERAILGLHVKAVADAPSSERLGARRFASAIVFDPRGYAVTVSYAVLDAVSIEARLQDGRRVSASLAGVDFESGLAVVKLDGNAVWPAAVLGDSRDIEAGAVTGTVGVDEDDALVAVSGAVDAVRRFSAYWEYMLHRAFIVTPSSPSWGGSALVNMRGDVVGIVSLRLGAAPHVNLAIPVETFLPVKDELIAAGRVVSRPPRPWLGLFTIGGGAGVVVDGTAPAGPASQAGFQRGDRVVGVNGVAVRSQEEFYEALWRGEAGDLVRVAVIRDDAERVIAVRSIDRARLYRTSAP
ncbi:MAG: S1C family serine protease [Candidatus Rokuibacteriota bacterium]